MRKLSRHCPIEFIRDLGANLFHLRLGLPEKLQPFQAGQFAELSLEGMVLPRPISILSQDEKGMEFLILKKGEATRRMLALQVGAPIHLTAPLGKSFAQKASSSQEPVLLVGGGVGVAPMLALFKEYCGPSEVLFGFRNQEAALAVKALNFQPHPYSHSTDDGSSGHKGFVSELLEDALKQKNYGAVFLCGPDAMMEACRLVCDRFQVPCYLSLETYMGCGLGICAACAVKKAEGGYFLACQEGPVFDSKQIQSLEPCHD
jgi:dihydroorotate dehydrogenase electron transfer subunit